MMHDASTILSDGQAVTVTTDSTNVFDCGPVRDIGRGIPHEVGIQVTETFTAAGAATFSADLYCDDNAAHATPTFLGSTGARPVAELVTGARLYIAIPPGAERYLRLTYTVATGPMTAGKVTAHVGPRQRDDSAKHYPRAAVAAA